MIIIDVAVLVAIVIFLEVVKMEEYRNLIIDMINKIENERFLKQIYTIVLMQIRKAGN